jgi:hypothetical protein
MSIAEARDNLSRPEARRWRRAATPPATTNQPELNVRRYESDAQSKLQGSDNTET